MGTHSLVPNCLLELRPPTKASVPLCMIGELAFVSWVTWFSTAISHLLCHLSGREESVLIWPDPHVQSLHVNHVRSVKHVKSDARDDPKLRALVYDILPSTTAVFSYAIGSRKLSANEQFFVGAQTVVSLLHYGVTINTAVVEGRMS